MINFQIIEIRNTNKESEFFKMLSLHMKGPIAFWAHDQKTDTHLLAQAQTKKSIYPDKIKHEDLSLLQDKTEIINNCEP